MKGKIYTIDRNVLATTDGAGNDTFQVLFTEEGRGYEFVMDLHRDHEEPFLVGFYALPELEVIDDPQGGPQTVLTGFTERRVLDDESMPCD